GDPDIEIPHPQDGHVEEVAPDHGGETDEHASQGQPRENLAHQPVNGADPTDQRSKSSHGYALPLIFRVRVSRTSPENGLNTIQIRGQYFYLTVLSLPPKRCSGASVEVALTRQVAMERHDLAALEALVAYAQQGAVEADRSGMFHGKAHGLGGRAETARALGHGRLAVAAQKEVAGIVENVGRHNSPLPIWGGSAHSAGAGGALFCAA